MILARSATHRAAHLAQAALTSRAALALRAAPVSRAALTSQAALARCVASLACVGLIVSAAASRAAGGVGIGAIAAGTEIAGSAGSGTLTAALDLTIAAAIVPAVVADPVTAALAPAPSLGDPDGRARSTGAAPGASGQGTATDDGHASRIAAAPGSAAPDPVRDLLQQLEAPRPRAAPRSAEPGAPATIDPGPAPAPASGSPAEPAPLPAGAVLPAATRDAAATPEAPGDLWARIRQGFRLTDLDTALATNRTKWYAAQPDYFARMAGRASMYLYFIVEEIERRGMPTELALLPFIESAMQPDATSRAKAAGLWQFIPSTGRLYALEQSPWKDARRDVVESTRAALDYLQALYAQFNDWNLALAAYNCGEASVDRALARNRSSGRPLDYTSLRLPRETQWYVPKLQAIKNIVRAPQLYGIDLPPIRNQPYFAAVSKSRDIDVATAAKLADMPIDQFRALNPAFSRPIIVGAGAPNILLPADHVETFGANLAAWESTGQPLASWTTYRLRSGETLAALAKRVGLSEAELREANRIPSRYQLGSGSTILIPRDESMEDDIDADSLAANFTLIPEPGVQRQVTYRVRRGDTLQGVAQRWGVPASDIVLWNDLHSNTLFAGQRLSLTVARAAAPARKKSPGRALPASATTATASASASTTAGTTAATATTAAAAASSATGSASATGGLRSVAQPARR